MSYSNVLWLLLFSIIVSSILLLGSLIVVLRLNENNKVAAYECGFEAFNDARNRFSIHFLLVGILFIVFDLEVIFLVPLVNYNSLLTLDTWWIIWWFIYLLLLGLVYEWNRGGLEWE